jgi:hypothetical protein
VSWVSTSVASFDIERGAAITESGREYTLHGPELPVAAQRAFFDVWSLPDGVELHRVAPEDVAAAIAGDLGPAPQSPEDVAERSKMKVVIYGNKIAGFAKFARLTDTDLTRILGISADDWRELKRGSAPKGLSSEYAEQVFSFVVAKMNGYNVAEPVPPTSAAEKERRLKIMETTAAEAAERRREIHRVQMQRHAAALPWAQIADPDMSLEDYSAANKIDADELRAIIDELPDDDDDYVVPTPGMRH